jgi:UDP-glucose 4-epimerase
MDLIITDEKPACIIHLAAQIDVSKSILDPLGDAEQNIMASLRLLSLCRKYGVRKFIYSSSCAVYGETEDCGITEDFPIRPISIYGVSKYVPEMYIRLFHELFGLSYTILRYANVYGPRQTPKGEGGVVPIFAQTLLHGKTTSIYGDGEQTRDFVYVKDVARANVLALHHGDQMTLNIGTNTKTSINELYGLISSLLSVNEKPVYLPGKKEDIRYSRLDHSNAEKWLGWKPVFPLLQGLTETLSYNAQNPD